MNTKIVISNIKKKQPFIDVSFASILFCSVRDWPTLSTEFFNLFIPIVSQDYKAYYDLKYESDAVIVPTQEKFEICLNKEIWYNFFKDNGLEKYCPEREMELFPCVLKPKIGYHSDGVKILYKSEKIPEGYFTEEFLEGNEYSSDIIFSPNQGIVKVLTIEYPAEVVGKIRKIEDEEKRYNWLKNNKIRKVELPENILSQISEILYLLQWNGVINFNFKIKDETIKIFDINPSWSGSSILHVEDIIKSLWQIRTQNLKLKGKYNEA
jgi:predicted ATP-grasp superfamily ATP-dependent carboligase